MNNVHTYIFKRGSNPLNSELVAVFYFCGDKIALDTPSECNISHLASNITFVIFTKLT